MTTFPSTPEFPRNPGISFPERLVPTGCSRCGGAGGWRGWPGFTCYRCGGTGTDPSNFDLAYPATWSDEECQAHEDKKTARREARQAREAAKSEAKFAAAIAANVAREPRLTEIIEAARADSDRDWEDKQLSTFTVDVALKGQFHELTDRQIETVVASYDKDIARLAAKAASEAEHAAAAPLENGRRELHGIVKSTKWQESDYGSTFKMLVELDDGCRVYGTVPAAFDFNPEGMEVTFTAKVERSADDHRFGFFSRPTKATAKEAA